MIIYFNLLIVILQILSAHSVSIRNRRFRNELVPYLNSRLENYKKDPNSLRIVSDDPFIIQLQVPENWDKKDVVGKEDKEKKGNKKRPPTKRFPKLKSWRRKFRIRRDIHEPSSRISSLNNEPKLNHQRKQFKGVKRSENQTSIHPEIKNRQEIKKVLNQIIRESKTNRSRDFRTGDERRGLEKSKLRNERLVRQQENSEKKTLKNVLLMLSTLQNRTTHRSLFPLSDRATVKLTHPMAPVSDQFKIPREMKPDRDRIEHKMKNLRNLLKVNDSLSGEDLARVRRKTDSDKLANKIAKMFLTLSAVNGMNDKKKSKCKEDEDDDDLWEQERRINPTRKNYSTNEERYKVKKWIEYLKNKRSGKTCPCMSGPTATGDFYDDPDVFPLEQKLGKDYPVTAPDTSSEEESLEVFRNRQRNRKYYTTGRQNRNRPRYSKGDDPDNKLNALTKRGRRKFELPLEDLESYRSRAKQILQNAEEILDKLKEEEEKRLANPKVFLSNLKELTSKIQGDPRSNENDLIKMLQKSLGLSKGENDKNAFIEGMKTYVLDPYEKAKALTDESTRQLTNYLLKNLANVENSGEKIDKMEKPLVKPVMKSLGEGILTDNSEGGKSFDVQKDMNKNVEESLPVSLPIEIPSQRQMNEMLKEQNDKMKQFSENPNGMSEIDAMKHLQALEDVVKDFTKETERNSQGTTNSNNEDPSKFGEALRFLTDRMPKTNQEDPYSVAEVKEINNPVITNPSLSGNDQQNTEQLFEFSQNPENENTMATNNFQPVAVADVDALLDSKENTNNKHDTPLGMNEGVTETDIKPTLREEEDEQVMKNREMGSDTIEAQWREGENEGKGSTDGSILKLEDPKVSEAEDKENDYGLLTSEGMDYQEKKPENERDDLREPLISQVEKTGSESSQEKTIDDSLRGMVKKEQDESMDPNEELEKAKEEMNQAAESEDENEGSIVKSVLSDQIKQTLEALEQKLEETIEEENPEGQKMSDDKETIENGEQENPDVRAENTMNGLTSGKKENLKTSSDSTSKENVGSVSSENEKDGENLSKKDENSKEVSEKNLEAVGVENIGNVEEKQNLSKETSEMRDASDKDENIVGTGDLGDEGVTVPEENDKENWKTEDGKDVENLGKKSNSKENSDKSLEEVGIVNNEGVEEKKNLSKETSELRDASEKDENIVGTGELGDEGVTVPGESDNENWNIENGKDVENLSKKANSKENSDKSLEEVGIINNEEKQDLSKETSEMRDASEKEENIVGTGASGDEDVALPEENDTENRDTENGKENTEFPDQEPRPQDEVLVKATEDEEIEENPAVASAAKGQFDEETVSGNNDNEDTSNPDKETGKPLLESMNSNEKDENVSSNLKPLKESSETKDAVETASDVGDISGEENMNVRAENPEDPLEKEVNENRDSEITSGLEQNTSEGKLSPKATEISTEEEITDSAVGDKNPKGDVTDENDNILEKMQSIEKTDSGESVEKVLDPQNLSKETSEIREALEEENTNDEKNTEEDSKVRAENPVDELTGQEVLNKPDDLISKTFNENNEENINLENDNEPDTVREADEMTQDVEYMKDKEMEPKENDLNDVVKEEMDDTLKYSGVENINNENESPLEKSQNEDNMEKEETSSEVLNLENAGEELQNGYEEMRSDIGSETENDVLTEGTGDSKKVNEKEELVKIENPSKEETEEMQSNSDDGSVVRSSINGDEMKNDNISDENETLLEMNKKETAEDPEEQSENIVENTQDNDEDVLMPRYNENEPELDENADKNDYSTDALNKNTNEEMLKEKEAEGTPEEVESMRGESQDSPLFEENDGLDRSENEMLKEKEAEGTPEEVESMRGESQDLSNEYGKNDELRTNENEDILEQKEAEGTPEEVESTRRESQDSPAYEENDGIDKNENGEMLKEAKETPEEVESMRRESQDSPLYEENDGIDKSENEMLKEKEAEGTPEEVESMRGESQDSPAYEENDGIDRNENGEMLKEAKETPEEVESMRGESQDLPKEYEKNDELRTNENEEILEQKEAEGTPEEVESTRRESQDSPVYEENDGSDRNENEEMLKEAKETPEEVESMRGESQDLPNEYGKNGEINTNENEAIGSPKVESVGGESQDSPAEYEDNDRINSNKNEFLEGVMESNSEKETKDENSDSDVVKSEMGSMLTDIDNENDGGLVNQEQTDKTEGFSGERLKERVKDVQLAKDEKEMDLGNEDGNVENEGLLLENQNAEPREESSDERSGGSPLKSKNVFGDEMILRNVNEDKGINTEDGEHVPGHTENVEGEVLPNQKNGNGEFSNNINEENIRREQENPLRSANIDPNFQSVEDMTRHELNDYEENKSAEMFDDFDNLVGSPEDGRYVDSTYGSLYASLRPKDLFKDTDYENIIGDSEGSKEYSDYYQERSRFPLKSDQLVKELDKKPKPGKIKIPQSIGKIMKDLGGNKEDLSMQNLDPEKIDDLIDRLEEADEQEQKESEEVDCRKECACADNIKTISRNRGRYEIMKDVLLWMKDMQLNRVLTD